MLTLTKLRSVAAILVMALVSLPALAAEDRWLSEFNITRESFDNPMVLIDTSAGEIVVELFPQEAPQTVANFIGLAEGTKPFTDPYASETGAPAQVNRPFYDGLVFHRVIDDFMIQSGSPTGLGDGGPGYQFDDEINARHLGLDKMPAIDEEGIPHPYLGINSDLDFRQTILLPLYQEMGIRSNDDVEARVEEVYDALDETTVMEVNERLGYQYNERYPSRMPLAGVLAMANSGPNTNGSQFFITLTDAPWLTGKYTVFGKVRAGMDVVETIGNTRTDENDRPIQNVTIYSIRQLEE